MVLNSVLKWRSIEYNLKNFRIISARKATYSLQDLIRGENMTFSILGFWLTGALWIESECIGEEKGVCT